MQLQLSIAEFGAGHLGGIRKGVCITRTPARAVLVNCVNQLLNPAQAFEQGEQTRLNRGPPVPNTKKR